MSRTFALLKLAGALVAAAWLAAPLAAQAQSEAGAAVVRADVGPGASAQTLALPVGRSAVVDLPTDARDVLVSNPAVAQAILRTPRRIFVLGMKSGVSDAVFFDAAGQRILTLSIRVDQNTSSLSETINRLIPDAHVRVDAINDSVILSGTVETEGDADKAFQIAKATVADASHVINTIAMAGKDQVMLKVRIIEMDRNVIKQLGVNWSSILDQAGKTSFQIGNAASYGVNGAILGGLTGTGTLRNASGTNQLTGELQAFERVGLVRTLAEPNLTSVSGEAAKFLVGGQFPVPTAETSTGQVSVQFKSFGVGLGFTPVVLSGGRISLKIATEVSELSNTGSFDISTGAGGPTLVVPSLSVRSADTNVELPSGGSMMIAGLLQDKSSENLDFIPGARDLPILGALLGSRDYQAGETELVIIVTPYLVNPASPADMQTPIDGLQIADDWDTLLLGHLNKTYNHPPEATAGRTYQGPYGYVVE